MATKKKSQRRKPVAALPILDNVGGSPKMKREFTLTFTKTIEIQIAEDVLEQGLRPDGPIFGKNVDLRMVVEHIAFNVLCNNLDLSRIDGYANCSDKGVSVRPSEWDIEYAGETLEFEAPDVALARK